LVVGTWVDGRVGTYRGIRLGHADYGVLVFGTGGTAYGQGAGGYEPLLMEVGKFFRTGRPPVSCAEALEIVAFMEAADESKRRGGVPVRLDEVVAHASKQESRGRAGVGR